MTSPVHGEALRTHAEVHGLRFQQFVLISHSPARCACPRLVQPKHPSS
ncbi:hypothetical protein ECP03052937_5091 [Escherichia coli p0305293.7]|nr:hypothetical protein ECP03052937_5091 [Escherichia coli p0305293.7]